MDIRCRLGWHDWQPAPMCKFSASGVTLIAHPCSRCRKLPYEQAFLTEEILKAKASDRR